MGAASVKTKVYEYCHDPNKEVVLLDGIDDGDTYTSVKFKTVLGAHATVNESDSARAMSVAFSGQVVTIHSSGLSDKDVLLTIFGIK